MHFADAMTGWVAGHNPTILKTTNGGSNWTAQSSSTIEDLYGTHFVDAMTGWAVGYSGAIVKTTDGGGP